MRSEWYVASIQNWENPREKMRKGDIVHQHKFGEPCNIDCCVVEVDGERARADDGSLIGYGLSRVRAMQDSDQADTVQGVE